VPSLENNRRLAVKAGLTDIPRDYSGLVKIPEKTLGESEDWLKMNKINPAKLIIISPGASARRAGKLWPAGNWEQLIKNILSRGYFPLITGAPSEKEDLDKLVVGFDYDAKVFVGSEGLLRLAALISKAKLFIGVDSGAMHLAASSGPRW